MKKTNWAIIGVGILVMTASHFLRVLPTEQPFLFLHGTAWFLVGIGVTFDAA